MTKTSVTTTSERVSLDVDSETEETLRAVEDPSEGTDPLAHRTDWRDGAAGCQHSSSRKEKTVNIVVRPLRRGRFAARLNQCLLCTSKTPLFAAARVLQRQGVPDDTPLTMTHEGSSTVALRSTVGRAASRIVHETDNEGPKFKRYRPMPGKLIRKG